MQAARAGSRQAFGELVDRYKRLICSLAYGFTGSVALSEDIAQEAFIKAWEELDQLREPARFRNWICAITRRLGGVADQKEGRFVYPVSAEIPALGADIPSMDPSPLDRMITREEVSLAWRALARVPRTYRLPLVLFYREDQSVEKVAQALGLTEETAKKRLYRGRQMLQEKALAIVEAALASTRISAEFTAGVIAAISVSVGATKADACMRTGVRSSSGAKAVLLGAAATIMAALPGGGATESAAHGHPSRAAAMNAPMLLAPSAVWLPPKTAGGASEEVDTGSALASATPSILDLDFEDGAQPPAFRFGQVTTCPPRSDNRLCILGSVLVNPNHKLKHDMHSTVGGLSATGPSMAFAYSDDLVVTFDYWLGDDAPWVALHLHDGTQNVSYYYYVTPAVSNAWAHAEVPVVQVVRNKEPLRMQEGDSIVDLYVHGGGKAYGPFYVDNLRIFHRTGGSRPTAEAR